MFDMILAAAAWRAHPFLSFCVGAFCLLGERGNAGACQSGKDHRPGDKTASIEHGVALLKRWVLNHTMAGRVVTSCAMNGGEDATDPAKRRTSA
jgi:hypothetical protein